MRRTLPEPQGPVADSLSEVLAGACWNPIHPAAKTEDGRARINVITSQKYNCFIIYDLPYILICLNTDIARIQSSSIARALLKENIRTSNA
jgi:hypothetical protein